MRTKYWDEFRLNYLRPPDLGAGLSSCGAAPFSFALFRGETPALGSEVLPFLPYIVFPAAFGPVLEGKAGDMIAGVAVGGGATLGTDAPFPEGCTKGARAILGCST